MQSIRFMNNQNLNWKCVNCDTVNIGRRCVVCGAEQSVNHEEKPYSKTIKSTIPEKREKISNKNILVLLIGIFLIITIILLLVAHYKKFSGKEENGSLPGNNPISHELVVEKEETDDEEEIYYTDKIYEKKLNSAVDKHEMDKHPDFIEKNREKISYYVPMNFRNLGNNEYFAYDESAYLAFSYGDNSDGKTIFELMEEQKSFFSDKIKYEKVENDYYIFSAEVDGIIYHRKEKVSANKKVSLIFVYPAEYKDIYDDYLEKINEGLAFPDTSGVEIIE